MAAEEALAQYKRDHPDVDDKDIHVALPAAPPTAVAPAVQPHAAPHPPVMFQPPYGHVLPAPFYNPMMPAYNVHEFHRRQNEIMQRMQADDNRIQLIGQRLPGRRAQDELVQHAEIMQGVRRPGLRQRQPGGGVQQPALVRPAAADIQRQIAFQGREDRRVQRALAEAPVNRAPKRARR